MDGDGNSKSYMEYILKIILKFIEAYNLNFGELLNNDNEQIFWLREINSEDCANVSHKHKKLKISGHLPVMES